jgi:hypothetical protein
MIALYYMSSGVAAWDMSGTLEADSKMCQQTTALHNPAVMFKAENILFEMDRLDPQRIRHSKRLIIIESEDRQVYLCKHPVDICWSYIVDDACSSMPPWWPTAPTVLPLPAANRSSGLSKPR